MTGHSKETTHYGLALVSNTSSFVLLASSSIAKPLTMTGHHEGETPHGLALMNKPSRLLSLAPLASQGLHTSTPLRPAITRRSHLMLLALHASLAYWLARASSRLHLRPANLGRGHLMVPSLDEQASLALLLGKMGHPWPATT
ncbi:hypothetical protein TIFTF001_038159 [Ficus carica]|uniref:Uncharacterized protein n=1 Tax=Ficus carica TaxID=3494 RepID=A0AA88JCL6_FICCA|nr:hypothetical protein TIFTF001_038159 [Ficus carica]